MGSFSVWHWLIAFIVLFGLNLPAYWVFRKAGWSGWWFLLLPIPLIGLVLLYVFAFRQWPMDLEKQVIARIKPGHPGPPP